MVTIAVGRTGAIVWWWIRPALGVAVVVVPLAKGPVGVEDAALCVHERHTREQESCSHELRIRFLRQRLSVQDDGYKSLHQLSARDLDSCVLRNTAAT